jgi:molybdopterin synthase catalytic subunit
MQVRVLYFGTLKDKFLKEGETIELPEGSTIATLREHYQKAAPEHGSMWKILAVAVNQEYAQASHPLKDGDEIALLPPVSGGSPTENTFVQLTREPIDSTALLKNSKAGEDGAALVFDGIVRNNTRGRKTLYLDYEAYEEMALRLMQDLASEAVSKYGVRFVSLVHRLGRLEIGESSVLIVVASAHRGAAFDACRWIIDTLKKTVPIWKKEYFEDGAVWADGEPFPDSIGMNS